MASSNAVLTGRTALVTGAAKRLGRAVALGLAEAGADVIVHYFRSEPEAAATAGEIEGLGRRAWTLGADLTDADAVASLIARAFEAAGRVDILVNNASIFPSGSLMEMTSAQLAENVQVNAWAPLQLCRDFAAGGGSGDIVNFLDCRIVDYDRHHVPYHLSKRMLLSLTRMLAVELAPRIKVNAVAPGLIIPPPGEDESFLARHADSNPLGRHGSEADVAGAVVMLAANGFITGQVIFVDGGRHLRGQFYG
jgi:pteridine reductase